MNKKTNNSFQYKLSRQTKTKPGSTFITFISNTTIPSGTAHKGSDEITINNDAHNQLNNPSQDIGKLTINYSNTSLLTISTTNTGLHNGNNPNQKLNINYHYQNNADNN